MIITLTGNNSFGLHKRLNELVDKFVTEHSELALERIDAEEADIQTILDALRNLPFLATHKMVVVRSLSQNKQAADRLEQIIDAAQGDTNLIIYEPAADKRTAYFKTLKAKTQLEELNELDASGLAQWLTQEAKNRGGELAGGDAMYMVERVGADQTLLSNELDKLITYEPKVTRQSIDSLTEPLPQSKVFELLDAAFAGDKSRALKLYEEQRAQKVEPQAILAMIAWQLQLLAITKHADGKSTATMSKDLGMSSYPLSKATRLAHKLSDNKLKEMVDFAFDIDWQSKTSALDLDEALKTYITTL